MTTHVPSGFPFVHRHYLPVILMLSLCLSPAKGAIQFPDGPSSPVYPEESPDPWTVPDTLSPIGTLKIGASSRINAGTLALGGRVIVEDIDSILQADVLDFQGTVFGNMLRSDLFVQAGTVQAGRIHERAETTMFLRAWDFGSITLSEPGGIGDQSTIVISLETGGAFTATGDQAFGGNQSSFSLGPGGGDSSVVVAKARISDAAMQAITEYIPSDIGSSPKSSSRPLSEVSFPHLANTIGQQTTFRVEGDAHIGGQTSDALIHLTQDSTFEVTGNLNGLKSQSIWNTVVINSDFLVGGSATFIDGEQSSHTTFIGSGNVDIGGDWTLANGVSSVSTFTATHSQIVMGGSLLMNLLRGSAIETTITNTTLEGGGDFSIGSPDTENAAVSFTIYESNLDFDGSLSFEVSDSSVMSGDVSGGSTIRAGEDLAFTVSGSGQSTDVLSIANSTLITGGSILIDSQNQGKSSSTLNASQLILNIGTDFRISRPGNQSDNTTLIVGTSGSIGRDLNLQLSAMKNSDSLCALSDIELTIGRDFTMTTGPAPINQICGADLLTLEIDRNFLLGQNFYLKLASSTLTVAGVVDIAGRLLPSGLTINGNTHIANTGNLQLTWTNENSPTPLVRINGELAADPDGEITVILQADPLPGDFVPLRHTGVDPLQLSGRLAVHFAHGYQEDITVDTRIPLIRSNFPINGSWSNATPGERILTTDGRGSFILDTNDAGTEIYLTAFKSTTPPNPVIREATADFQNGALFVKWTPFGNGEFYQIQYRSNLKTGSWTSLSISPPSFSTSAYLSLPESESADAFFVRILDRHKSE